MVEGLYFYWLAWAGWILSTFFMKKGREREVVTITVLIAILVSKNSFIAGAFQFNNVWVLILIISLFVFSYSDKKRIFYHWVSALTITFAFTSFWLFRLYDPVWMFMDEKWMLSLFLAYLSIMLAKDWRHRAAYLMAGVAQGDLLFALILSKFSFPYEVASLATLDSLSISLMLAGCWCMIEHLQIFFGTYAQRNGKEKPGSYHE